MHQQSLYLFIFLIKIKACRFYYKVDDISQGSLSNFKTQVTFFGHCTVLRAHVSEHGYSITHVFNFHNPVTTEGIIIKPVSCHR